jgi:glutamyl-tRNA synthetase
VVGPDTTIPPFGRLAPSPTGLLHLGHARSFLLAWWSIRARSGRIVLRIEDLDVPRVEPGMIDAMLRDLEWLGLDWDGAPRLQSSGLERLRAASQTLVDRGVAYPCVCSRGDVRIALGAPHGGVGEVRYPGTCRGRFTSIQDAAEQSGRAAALRLFVPPGPVTIDDLVVGARAFDVAAEVGDFVVMRRGGLPAYQLAVAVDDAFDGVTEVLRGDDLLPSAARQWHVQTALGLAHPTWAHVPLVVDAVSGQRLAKRHDALSLAELRTRGVDPRAIVGWAARTSGMDVARLISAAEGTRAFDLERLPRVPVRIGASDVAALETASR